MKGDKKDPKGGKSMNYSLVEDEKVKVKHLRLWWDYFEQLLIRLCCKFYHGSHFQF